MLDINLLNRSFPSSENPGLDTLDPRFQEIASLVEADDLIKVATQVEALFNESIYDIRLIGYYLGGVFFEQGLKSLSSILLSLAKTLKENWDAFGPIQKKEKHTQRSISWALTKLMQLLQYHQEKADEEWQKWLQTVSFEDVQNISNSCEEFRQTLIAKMQDPANLEEFGKLTQWIKDFEKNVKPPEESAPEFVPEEETESKETEQHPSASPDQMIPGIEISYHLQTLLKKIDAFEVLVQKGDFLKASVVSDDINTLIGSFDPRMYFPKTFAKYYKNLSASIDSVAPNWDAKESLGWQTLSQFYKVDLDGFING